jgi:hypothetical protein
MSASPSGWTGVVSRIASAFGAREGVGTRDARWLAPGTATVVAGIGIPDGMIYVGRGWEYGACVIDPELPVASSPGNDGKLGYWPAYAGITPTARRNYLEWLSGGRRATSADLGYVFLFFYGLERRLLLDLPPPGESALLCDEIRHLRRAYGDNRSLGGYAARLLDAASFLAACADPGTPPAMPELDRAWDEMPPLLKVSLAREVAGGRPLGVEHAPAAFYGLRNFWPVHRDVPGDARDAFLHVFRQRFAAAYPSGIRVAPRGSHELSLPYRGATAGLTLDLAAVAGLQGLPDPAALDWSALRAFGERIADDLAPWASKLASDPGSDVLERLLDCPPEIRDRVAVGARTWLASLPAPSPMKLGKLARHALGVPTPTWTPNRRRRLAEVLAAAGYATEPGPEDRGLKFGDDAVVQVFPWPSGRDARESAVACAAATLVAVVAHAGNWSAIHLGERWLAAQVSEGWPDAGLLVRLRARLAWLDRENPSVARAVRMLGEATGEERDFCAAAAVTAGALAGTGNRVTSLLEEIHVALKLPRDRLYAALHEQDGAPPRARPRPAPRPDDGLVAVEEGTPAPVHAIPRPPGAERPGRRAGSGLGLDDGRIERVRVETERVAAMLGEVLADDAPREEAAEAEAEAPAEAFAGLDGRHAALLAVLLSRPGWPRAEFDAAASAAGLLPDGAMEVINEWAYEKFGEPLVEDGETVAVAAGLVPSAA